MPKYHLVVSPRHEEDTIAAADLEVGQLAMGIDREFAGILFLRVFGSVISLTDPQKTWKTVSYPPTFRVRPLKPGTVVRLTTT